MDDLISRQAAIEALEKFEKQCWEDMCFRPLMSDARMIIKVLPSVDPKQRTGRWELAIGYDPKRKFMCDQCARMAYEQSKYCPNCGAKMEVE